MSGHVVLIGDSIFDNAAYVPGGLAVIHHIEQMLTSSWQATLAAVDGATVSAVFGQLDSIPADATHLVLSVGGNDALWVSGSLLAGDAANVRDALEKVESVRREFLFEYSRLVKEILAFRLPLVLCTVYDSVPGLAPAERAGLCVFNDAITRTASDVDATFLDLRTICDEATDYSTISPIEPSESGGRKIARAIVSTLKQGQG